MKVDTLKGVEFKVGMLNVRGFSIDLFFLNT